MADLEVTVVPTTPFEGQKPGTSGLRKKTKVFQQEHYAENFIQACFNALDAEKLKGCTLVVGGDGRYLCKETANLICKMAAAHDVARCWVGRNALISTPCVSSIIRDREGGVAYGGFILTASHNPGGPDEDFGLKYNCENGGPAPESMTNAIYKDTTTISSYKICKGIPDVDLSKEGKHEFGGGKFVIEVIDTTIDYVNLMKQVFDFDALKTLVARPDFKICYDAMHGVAGEYAQKIFIEELGADPSSLINSVPKEDFGKGHPDPNLTYAAELVKIMGLQKDGSLLPGADAATIPDFGAAADGDADRNMILGKQFFASPSDSVAIIADNADCIPFFKNAGGLKAIARSMPTSGAADRVAEKKGLKFFETPTGWKFFGNVMDSKVTFNKEDYNPMVCGEESFGTGSNHVREKDGIWAVLAWLSIIASKQTAGAPLVPVSAIVEDFWKTYGRCYYCRHDYEGVESEKAAAMMSAMTAMCGDAKPDIKLAGSPLKTVDEFDYLDPIDGSRSPNQGWRFLFEDGSRFVFRLSGTGSSGATIRLYLEKYEADPTKLALTRDEALGEMVNLALQTSRLKEFTGRDEPTVIT
jgi:phosphoglucomutase